ncbi:MAG: M20/M25/M40 family metallo-hydrolase [Planctomycetes bacterium]|nr:M20/M25/M40 family metallo-hydrolase [Planctomycetota bacterium]
MDAKSTPTGPRTVELLGAALFVVLLGALALAVFARRLPEALGLDAPLELFSAARAREVLERFALRPHPVGTGEHECVRETVVAELVALGLEPEQREGLVNGLPLSNLVARLPGYASTGTVLCVAHYDTKPTSPGAGDDGAGTVAWLEALRALRARGWQPRNDVLLLLSDGEELGLLGARLFARERHALDGVSVVVNLEAIGNGGPAVLFELGPRNGPRVREYARVAANPAATSLADAIYARMPNDTDLSVFLRRGLPGFNLALTTGNAAYHAPHDTPANLDPRGLQHLGESALALLEALGERDLAAGMEASDVSYFDVFGRTLLVWPRELDVVPVLLGALWTAGVWRRARRSWRELPVAWVRHALAAAGPALLFVLGWGVLDALLWCVTPSRGWVAGNTTSGALLFAALVLVLAGRAARRKADPARERDALAAWSSAAAFALVACPGASYALAWPLVCASAASLVAHRPGAGLAGVLGFATALLVGLPLLYLLLQLFLRQPPVALFLVGFLLAAGGSLFQPELERIGRARGTLLMRLGVVALLASLVVARVLVWRQGALWP